MRDRRELHEAIRLDFRQATRQRVIVARVEHMQRDTRFAQQPQPLEDEADVEILFGIAAGIGERAEIVDLQPVDDMRSAPWLLQRQRQIVADETGAADQRDRAAFQLFFEHDSSFTIFVRVCAM